MNERIVDQLRRVANEIRRSPVPISEFIPLLQKAADEIDTARVNVAKLAFLLGQASANLRVSTDRRDQELLIEIVNAINKAAKDST
jgi:hypothetical protein